MKRLLLAFLLSVSTLLAQQSVPVGYVNPVGFVGINPSGGWNFIKLDASGNVYSGGAGAGFFGQSPPTGYVQPYAIVGLTPSGFWSYLQFDSHGNLLTAGSGTNGATGGTGTQLQYRVSATTYGGVAGSVWDGTTLTLPQSNILTQFQIDGAGPKGHFPVGDGTAYVDSGTPCANAGGTCGTASSGSVSIAAGATTITVTTSAVTATSQILVFENATKGTALTVTCNTTLGRTYMVTTQTGSTSFIITSSAAPSVNPACLDFLIVN